MHAHLHAALVRAGHIGFSPPIPRAGSPITPVKPSANNLPGSSVIHNLTSGIEAWALIAAVIGIVIGAVIWAFGHYSHNYEQAYNGRRGVMVSALAGILIGGAPYIVNWFDSRGSSFQ